MKIVRNKAKRGRPIAVEKAAAFELPPGNLPTLIFVTAESAKDDDSLFAEAWGIRPGVRQATYCYSTPFAERESPTLERQS